MALSAAATFPTAPDGGFQRAWFSSLRELEYREQLAGPAAVGVLSEAGYGVFRRFGYGHVVNMPGRSGKRWLRVVDVSVAPDLDRLDARALAALFDAPQPWLPVVLKQAKTSRASCETLLRVPPDLLSLQGHFDAMPIVPGVVQISWVLHFAENLTGLAGSMIALDNVKFRRLVQPGQELSLELECDLDGGKLNFAYRSTRSLHTIGKILLGPAHV